MTQTTRRALLAGLAASLALPAAAHAASTLQGPRKLRTSGPSARPLSPDWATSSLLRWAPPPQTFPIVVDVPVSGNFRPANFMNNDVILRMPTVAREQGASIHITGGRHVRIIGGHSRGTISFWNTSGSIFAEGLVITPPPDRDGIAWGSASGGPNAPDVYVQNCQITGLSGSAAGFHADAIQAWGDGPTGCIRIHRVSATTNYQSFFLPNRKGIVSTEISLVDLAFTDNSSPTAYHLWFRDVGGAVHPVDLYEVFLDLSSHPTQRLDKAVMPDRDREPTIAAILQSDGSVIWPPAAQITGRVRPGRPPTGSFVRNPGLGYVSPGYSRSPEVV